MFLMIYNWFYLWVKKMQLYFENEKAFLSIHFNLNYGTDSLPRGPSWPHKFCASMECPQNSTRDFSPFISLFSPIQFFLMVCLFFYRKGDTRSPLWTGKPRQNPRRPPSCWWACSRPLPAGRGDSTDQKWCVWHRPFCQWGSPAKCS